MTWRRFVRLIRRFREAGRYGGVSATMRDAEYFTRRTELYRLGRS